MVDMNFQSELLKWYQDNKRELAFRKEKDAYKIWISEIMAQQTRIEAMLPYFERFMEACPNMESLAKCEEEKLNKLWQGLGYYSRARNLKKCAMQCMQEYAGQLPRTKKELKKLPGIGPYTAGAIASIAYNERVSAIDGNVNRVFSRLYNIHDDLRKSAGKKKIAEKVEASLPDASCISDYNQALMELGALVCTVGKPKCACCPIQAYCQAYQYADPSKLPVQSKLKQRRIEEKTIYIYNVCDHQECYKEVGSQAISYTTGVPAMIGAALVVDKVWDKDGVFNIEEFDPDPFMDMLNQYGLPWVVDEDPQIVE